MGLFDRKEKQDGGGDLRSLYGNSGTAAKREYYFGEDRKTVNDLIAPNGANLSRLPYITIQDGGVDYYCLGLYIEKMARRPTMASTFSKLFDYPGVTSTVYVHPLLEESIKRVNKRIDMLDSELIAAEENRTRYREISGKMRDTEALAVQLDSGESTLYEVYFLFLLKRTSLEDLYKAALDMASIARSENMELSATYAAHPEAFLSSLPVNRMYPVKLIRGAVEQVPVKKHVFNEESLSTIFNHTASEFSHRNGALIGHNMYSGMPFLYDPFDKSHFSYGVVVSGMTGYGKSATVKQICTRLVLFDYSFASIDYENNGRSGEYAAACEAVGGVNYVIGARGGDKINLFEINEELELDEVTKREYRVLRVNDKIVDLSNILLSIALSATAGESEMRSYEAAEVDRMQEIITRVVQTLYRKFGIVEGDPDSLYEDAGAEGGMFSAGRRPKHLPRMKDFYLELLRAYISNADKFKENAYSLLIDKFSHRVAELYYCPECLQEFTRDEVMALPRNAAGVPYHDHGERKIPIVALEGAEAYFDCESTVRLSADVPWYNFDISGAPETERPVLILICQNFINENFIKRNSVDPRKAKKLIFLIDEFHKIKQPKAIAFVAATYRTARKRHVSPWIITQSIADLDKFREAEEITKQSETLMLLKHQYKDRDAIKKATFLTDSQVDAVLNLGGDSNNKRHGEVCVVDMSTSQASFIKVDYLKSTEAFYVETDTEKRAEIAGGK